MTTEGVTKNIMSNLNKAVGLFNRLTREEKKMDDTSNELRLVVSKLTETELNEYFKLTSN